MKTAGRGWTGAKPASEYTIRYGHGLVRRESSGWPPYVVVSTPQACEAAKPYLAQNPAGVACAQWLDWSHLQEISDSLPDGAQLVIGLGGGRALDAAKYVALKKALRLILVPTIVSSGAIIHGHVPKWKGRKIIGPKHSWPWINADEILVDYDLVLTAPHYLNTAGLADILCGNASISEWRRNARLGTGPPFDKTTIARTLQHYRDIVDGFPRTLTAVGELSADSVHFIMTALQERDAKSFQHHAAPGGDHSFWLAMEQANNKGWVHGEMVALGAVIIAWHCEESPAIFISWLDACKVRRRPTEMGISREELQRGLEFAPRFLSDKESGFNVPSILRHEPIVGAKFERLWESLEC